MMQRLVTIFILLLGLFSPQMLLGADFTQRLNFQGKLSDTGAAANGTYNIKFELCSASDCSTVIWTEYHDAANAGQVTVTNGIFNTILGTDEVLTSVDFDQALWIRITVDGTGASPSYATSLGIIPLGSTPAAQEAKSLSGRESTDFMQVIGGTGTEIDFGLGVVPYLSTAGGNFVTRVGYLAGYSQTGHGNTFVGYTSGLSASGWQNTALGDRAGGGITGGGSNTALGYFAGRKLASGTANTLVGARAGIDLTGDSNVFVGADAGYVQTTGVANVFVGTAAGRSSTSASTTAIGYQAGYNTTGPNNTFIGYDSGYANTSGLGNTFLGYRTGVANTTGNYNTFIGGSAGLANATGTSSTFIGSGAGSSAVDDGNLAIGVDALTLLVNGENNISIGNSSMYFANNVSGNLAIGNGVGGSMTGSNNILIGTLAGTLSSASDSIFIGANAGQGAAGSNKLYIENTSSASPLIYGEFDNDIVRINGQLQSTGGIAIGSTSTDNLIDDASNGSSSATLYIGNETIDTSVSDRRLKANISPVETSALGYLSQFNVVAFDWLEGNERRGDGRVPFGLIAQDVAEIAPQYTKQGDSPEDYMSVRFQDMVPLTIKAIQEIDARVAQLELGGVRGAVNSVTNLVELVVDRLRVRNELCIGETCVDEATLKELLADDGEAAHESAIDESPLPIPSQAEEPQEPQVVPVQETASTTKGDLQEAPTEDTASTTPADVSTDEPGEEESQPEESEEEPVETEEVLEEQEAESVPAPEPETTASSTPAGV